MSSVSIKVPFGQKLAFGVGMFANQMFPAILGIFMIVLIQDLKFAGWMWSFVFLFPRIFDAFLDPLMGFISDNTKSKWGRRRQYVFIGAIIMGISFSLLLKILGLGRPTNNNFMSCVFLISCSTLIRKARFFLFSRTPTCKI